MFSHSIVHNHNDNHMWQFPAPLKDRSRTSWKPNIEQAPSCPRCASSNTKFCYYNNYSLSQPRYFCKGCRRYWTKGGSLRNVPLGGGCRKSGGGKAAKQAQNELSPMTHTRRLSENLVSENSENGSDIDMAVVFAKFLNQNLNSGQEFNNEANMSCSSSSSTLSSILTLESVEAENDESQKPCERDPITDSGILLGELPREEMVENIVGEGLSGMELQGLLGGDELGIQDVLWSEDATTSCYSATCWQPPMMELQQSEDSMSPWNEEYGQFPMRNTFDGWSHWNSYDPSALEVFSRP